MVNKTICLVEGQAGGPEALAVLRRLAVCRGGFTSEAAQAIMGADADPHALALLKQPRLSNVPLTDLKPLLEAGLNTIKRRSLVFILSDFIIVRGIVKG